MSHAKILLGLGSSSALPVAEEATAVLKRFEQAYSDDASKRQDSHV